MPDKTDLIYTTVATIQCGCNTNKKKYIHYYPALTGIIVIQNKERIYKEQTDQ